MATRSVLGLLYILQGMRQLGEDVDSVLQRYGMALDKIDPNTRIERARELQIYVDLAAILRTPQAGLKLGNNFGFASYGPLVMLLMTCSNAYESFQTGVRFQQLTYLYGSVHFEPGEGSSALVIKPLPMPEPAFRFRVDGEVAGTFKLLRDMQSALGVNILPERIELPYPSPPPAEARVYEQHFGCAVSFGHSATRIWMRNEHLQMRFPTADPNAHAIYLNLCNQQLLQQQETAETLAARVLIHLELFVQSFPTAADVARSFDLSERSLRRQLADESTSFRTLLGQARLRKAQQLLGQSSLSVEAVSQQLGYAEPAAFIHAFTRWSGCTPAAWRRQHSAGGATAAGS